MTDVFGLESHESLHPGRYFTRLDDGRVRCDVCPRRCEMKSGQRGFCFVRMATDDGVALTTYGRSSGFCIDPIEKKPLNHFLPGTPVLSFGTAGCNLGCKFCQNHDISKAREMDRLQDIAPPVAIAEAALEAGADSVAYTYNDPAIFLEYAVDTAAACRERGIKNVAVTAGYITPEARGEFFEWMDAANIDLKGFTDDFYWRLCAGHLEPVLDTIRYVARETDTWLELTTLLIPDANDSDDELKRLAEWVAENAVPDVPLHFSAFHPDFKLTDRGPTPVDTLRRARAIALEAGLNYVYTGNVHDAEGDTTFCPGCKTPVIERDWYDVKSYELDGNACRACGHTIAGVFAADGLPTRKWGRKRLPIHIG
jgi:pyruvate formate lyase activating enzyme